MTRFRTRLVLALAAVAALLGLTANAASAATVQSYNTLYDEIGLSIVAGPGEQNNVLVSADRDARRVLVEDPGNFLIVGDGCERVSPDAALCDRMLWQGNKGLVPRDHLDARASRGLDWFSGPVLRGGDGRDKLAGGKKSPSRLYGDNGNDVLHGGKRDDYLKGGGGHDKLRGGPGQNKIKQ